MTTVVYTAAINTYILNALVKTPNEKYKDVNDLSTHILYAIRLNTAQTLRWNCFLFTTQKQLSAQ